MFWRSMTDRIASSRITSPQKGLAATTAINGLTGTATTGFFHPILTKKAVKGFGLKSNFQERSLHAAQPRSVVIFSLRGARSPRDQTNPSGSGLRSKLWGVAPFLFGDVRRSASPPDRCRTQQHSLAHASASFLLSRTQVR